MSTSLDPSLDIDRAISLAKMALDHMRERDIPPLPENYAVWYAYCSNADMELRNQLAALMTAGTPFTPELNRDLYDRFIGLDVDRRALTEIASEAHAELARVVETVQIAGKGTGLFGETLDGVSRVIGNSDGSIDLPELINGVLSATRVVQKANVDLQTELNQSVQQMDTMKQDLKELRAEVMTDGLTGVANRKMFDQDLRRAAFECTENGQELCLMMLDIDHFKHFNDTHGHQTGDQVLRLVAKTLRNCVKGRDTTARYGGEEFAVILEGASLNDAVRLADYIRDQVACKRIVNRSTGIALGHITVSLGVAQFRPGESLDDFMYRADKALYAAKLQGRNRVASETELSDDASTKAVSVS